MSDPAAVTTSPPPSEPIVQETPRPALGFWEDPTIQNWLPFATSLVIHIAIITIGVLLAAALPKIVSATREQTIIPDSAIVEGAQLGGIPNPGLGGDPNLEAAQNVDTKVTQSDSWNQAQAKSLNSALLQGAASDSADSVIGLGEHKGILGGDGQSNGGGGNGGPLAPLGVPGGGTSLGPKSPFMGVSGNARKIIYIVDASGTMMSIFPRVKLELHKAIDVLKPVQAFNVIFFNDQTTSLNSDGLIMATPDWKQKAFALAGTTSAASSTEPMQAIHLAFKQQPELIYILTDGFESQQNASPKEVAAEIRKLNTDKKIRINVILIRSNDDAEFVQVAKSIANDNGGICKVIDRQDL